MNIKKYWEVQEPSPEDINWLANTSWEFKIVPAKTERISWAGLSVHYVTEPMKLIIATGDKNEENVLQLKFYNKLVQTEFVIEEPYFF